MPLAAANVRDPPSYVQLVDALKKVRGDSLVLVMNVAHSGCSTRSSGSPQQRTKTREPYQEISPRCSVGFGKLCFDDPRRTSRRFAPHTPTVRPLRALTPLRTLRNPACALCFPSSGFDTEPLGFELRPIITVQTAADGSTKVGTIWQVAEFRTALCMAQRLEPGVHFYENLRLQHSAAHAASGLWHR